jgi:hypothetical protein
MTSDVSGTPNRSRNSQWPMRGQVFRIGESSLRIFNRLESREHVKNLLLFVKQKPPAAILARAIALGLCFFDSTSAQLSDEKPEKAFWPREVRISEEVKLEQKTKYGVVTAKRIAGSVVKVVSLDSDSLRIESDGFSRNHERWKDGFLGASGEDEERGH